MTCFAITISDIVKQLSTDMHCSLYVDDFVIYVSARNIAHSSRMIQGTINKLMAWTKEKGMRFLQEKTVVVKFYKIRT